METDPTRMCALLVGLPDVMVVGVGEWPSWLRIVISTTVALLGSPVCCGVVAHRHGVRAPWSWSTCRCSGGRRGWCGASSAGAAGCAAGPGLSRTRRSRRHGAR